MSLVARQIANGRQRGCENAPCPRKPSKLTHLALHQPHTPRLPPRLHYRLLTLCPAPTDTVPVLARSVSVCMYVCIIYIYGRAHARMHAHMEMLLC